MSPTTDPTLTEKETNVDLAQVISQGFARIESEIASVKTEVGQIKTKLDRVETELNDVKTELNDVKTQMKIEFSEVKADIKIIDNKVDAQFQAVNVLQKRVDSSEADRSRLIAGLIGAVIATLMTLAIQKLFSSETPRNPTNRSAIEYPYL
jgi:septal ring factor EnvC (AmiA/AmiB activator)